MFAYIRKYILSIVRQELQRQTWRIEVLCWFCHRTISHSALYCEHCGISQDETVRKAIELQQNHRRFEDTETLIVDRPIKAYLKRQKLLKV